MLVFEAAWFTVYFLLFFLSLSDLRDETHPKHFFLSKLSSSNCRFFSGKTFLKSDSPLLLIEILGIVIYMVHTYCRNFSTIFGCKTERKWQFSFVEWQERLVFVKIDLGKRTSRKIGKDC